ncbi:hypothetical protein J6590_012091 [Homalodisca vitripennis]|nr:hypothetical protein J6590_012091 [Homalodisca vitripennis]
MSIACTGCGSGCGCGMETITMSLSVSVLVCVVVAVQVYGAPQYLYQDLDQDNGLQQAQLQALQAQLESLQGQPLYDGPDDDGQ